MSGGPPLRRRRRDTGAKPNHERWMVSYADLLTLLLGLFIVLYATSAQNTSKMKEMATSLMQAFSGKPPAVASSTSSSSGHMTALPKPVALPVQAPAPMPAPQTPVHRAEIHSPDGPRLPDLNPAQAHSLQHSVDAMKALHSKLQALLQSQIDAKMISISATPLAINISVNAKILFANGDATLTPGAIQILTPLAQTLSGIPEGYRIAINGYTDDKPIHTDAFPSNWQLSTARAVSVVELFLSQKVPGDALSAAGFSKYHPVAPNDTEEGRQQNRRVAIEISAPKPAGDAGDAGDPPAEAAPSATAAPQAPPAPAAPASAPAPAAAAGPVPPKSAPGGANGAANAPATAAPAPQAAPPVAAAAPATDPATSSAPDLHIAPGQDPLHLVPGLPMPRPKPRPEGLDG